jgi:hypothetical protein
MTRDTVICKARTMPKQIPLEFCVPNPVHPACKQCTSPMIAEMKPEAQARLRRQDAEDDNGEDLLFEEPGGFEPDEDDFEELKED